MKNELKGTIHKIFDPSNGVILGEDGREYYFSKIDFIKDFEVVQGKIVIFKPVKYMVRNFELCKAILIEESLKS